MKNPSSDNNARRKRTSTVEANDRFLKIRDLLEDSKNVWLVSHKLELAGLPPHVRIVDERAPQRSVTVAVSALLDKRLYHRLEAAPRLESPQGRGALDPDGVLAAPNSDDSDLDNTDPMEPVGGPAR